MHEWPVRGKAALAVLLIAFIVGATLSHSPGADAQGGGSISYGSKVLGRISADLPEVMYSFSGTAGDLVQVHVKNWVGTLDPQVALLAPDGQTIGSSTRNPFAVESQNAMLALFLPQTGIYTLLVSAENGTNGQFVLTLQGRGAIVATPLLYGQGLDVYVPQDPPPQYFAFETEDCPTVFTVANLSEGQPFTFPFMVKVRNAQGNLIALLYGGDAVEDRLVLPARSGRYEVEVFSEDPQQEGTIHLLVTCADQAPGCVSGGATGAAGAGLSATAGCPPCFSEDFGGELCDEFEVTATHEGDSTFSFSWPAVEGADWYIFSIVDAWGNLLLDSPVMLEDETSHLYALQPADFGRGPFTAYVQAGTETGELLCVDETEFSFEGPPLPECTITVGVDIVPTEERMAVVGWTPVPGAAAYTIHLYAVNSDGSLVGIRVFTVPGDANSYHLNTFPGDYTQFRVSVRAYSEASGGGVFGDLPQGFLCEGSADFGFGPDRSQL